MAVGGKVCSFFGIGDIAHDDEVYRCVDNTISELLDDDVNRFIFYGTGKFIDICYEIVTKYKRARGNIERIACIFKNEWACLEENVEGKNAAMNAIFGTDLTAKFYDEVDKMVRLKSDSPALIGIANNYVVGKSDVCVFYVREKPVEENKENHDILLAMRFARRKGKKVINICNG